MQHACYPLSCQKSACADAPWGPLSEAARAHLSPNRPLIPGDAYEADVEPLVEAAGSPGVHGAIPPGWLLHLPPVRRPAPSEPLPALGGPRRCPVPSAPGMSAETPPCRGLARAPRRGEQPGEAACVDRAGLGRSAAGRPYGCNGWRRDAVLAPAVGGCWLRPPRPLPALSALPKLQRIPASPDCGAVASAAGPHVLPRAGRRRGGSLRSLGLGWVWGPSLATLLLWGGC